MGVRASAPLRRKRGSEAPSPAAEPPLELAIISDPGEDLDDELAMVYLRHLVALYPSLVVRCVVCNLRPARKRAALMRQTLDALNMKHVPVGVGDEVVPPSRARDDDEDWAFIDAGAYASVHADGQVLLLEAFEAADDGALTLLCISALTDAAAFLEEHEGMFRRKVKEVVIMGGVEAPGTDGLLNPDDAANNAFDKNAARSFYGALQRHGVPMVVVSRSAAYACPVPRTLYDELAATGHPVGVRVRDAQREAIARLWRRAHATTPAGRAHLPERCDPRWFRDTFCNGRGEDLGPGDDVWDLVVGFNLYDVIALLACCPALRAAHFSPHSVNVAGVRHQVVGRGDAATGVRDADALRKALADGIRDGIARAPGPARRAAR